MQGSEGHTEPLGCGPGKGGWEETHESLGWGLGGFAEFLSGEASRENVKDISPPLSNYVTLTRLGGYSRTYISLTKAESL